MRTQLLSFLNNYEIYEIIKISDIYVKIYDMIFNNRFSSDFDAS